MEVSEWDERAAGYNKLIRRIFPDYEVLHNLVWVLLSKLEPGASVLVVGAGTGHETARLAKSRPDLKITAQDISAGMIEQAKADYPDLGIDWQIKPVSELPDTKYDAAALILVLHFLPDDGSEEGKQELLRQISKRLKSKAKLVYADLMPEPESMETLLELWKEYSYAISGADERLEGAFEYLGHEIPVTTPARNQELLESVGFEEPVTLFQHFWQRLLVTRRR